MAKLSELPLYDQFEYAKRFGQFPADGTLTEFVNSRSASQASQTAAAPIPQDNAGNRALNQFRGSEIPESKTFLDYFSRDPIASLLNRSDDPARVMPDPTNASANTSSMPSFNLGNLTNYIPSASTIGEYIPTSLPNVFGVNNPLYAGLLGEPQSQALSKQSNIAGLLGAAAALVQGMGRQGGRRSAAGNIINALGAGYGSAGQAYQQGLQSYGQAQQLALQQRQQAGIQAMKNKYPDLADEFDTNPAGAFRIVSEREAARVKPTVVSEGGTLVSPTGDVLFSSTKTKPQARILTADEIAIQGLPTSGGQKYQIDANGKIDLIQGTAPNKPATSIEEFQFYQSQGGKKSYENFMKDKTPSTTVNVMPQGSVPLGKEGANKVDTALLDLGQNRLNLQSIAYNFKPEYLQDTFKLRMAASAKAESLGLPVDDKTKTEIANYSKFTQDAYNGLNAYINLITGAAVGSGAEEARIRKGVPDPQKDSPTEFWTKLNSKMREGRLYEARLGYIKQNGMKITDVSVEKIPTLMRQTEAKLKSDNKLFGNKPYNDKDPNHKSIVRALMSKEFGLME